MIANTLYLSCTSMKLNQSDAHGLDLNNALPHAEYNYAQWKSRTRCTIFVIILCSQILASLKEWSTFLDRTATADLRRHILMQFTLFGSSFVWPARKHTARTSSSHSHFWSPHRGNCCRDAPWKAHVSWEIPSQDRSKSANLSRERPQLKIYIDWSSHTAKKEHERTWSPR